MSNNDNIIFRNGIELVGGLERNNGGGFTPDVSAEELEMALKKVLPQIVTIDKELAQLPEMYKMSQQVIDVKIKPGYLSKSNKISEMYQKSGLERVGSLPVRDRSDEQKDTRIEYLRGNPNLLEKLIRDISNGERLTKRLQNEVVKIDEISLPTNDDKIKLLPGDWKSGQVYLVLHPMGNYPLLIEKLRQILKSQNPSDWKILETTDGLVYISMFLTHAELSRLVQFNPLRQVIENQQNVQIEKDFEKSRNIFVDDDYQNKSMGLIPAGEIDGGLRTDHNLYLSEVKEIGSVDSNTKDFFVEHGTAVSSLLMYGSLNQKSPGQKIEPDSRIKTIRILPTSPIATPSAAVEDFDFVEAASLLKKIIPQNLDVKVWNISVGPYGPVLDDSVGPLTAALDELAFKYRIIFCAAVGNTGELANIMARIQTPADMVNGLAVGSFAYDEIKQPKLATYTSVGPGRAGAIIKPDFLGHGGSEDDKLETFSTANYATNKVYGTSFASPLVANLATKLLNADPDLTPLDAKTMLIHQATLNPVDGSPERVGRGVVEHLSDVLVSPQNEFRILYSSEMSTGTFAKLEIPLPDGLKSTRLEFSWTVSLLTAVSPSEVDEYTQYTIEDDFYGNADKYDYRKNTSVKTRLNSDAEVERLLLDGWKPSALPTPNKNKYKYLTEPEQRKKMKWDTVKSDRVGRKRDNVKEPFLVLHALARDGSYQRIPYSVVITVRAVNDTNIYELVKQQFPVLQPLRINAEVRNNV